MLILEIYILYEFVYQGRDLDRRYIYICFSYIKSQHQLNKHVKIKWNESEKQNNKSPVIFLDMLTRGLLEGHGEALVSGSLYILTQLSNF